MARGLSDKQKQFVEEYLIDFNATQAAIRAGYSERSAGKIGWQLLGKTRVSEALAQRSKELLEQAEITPKKVLSEISHVSFSRMRDYATWGPEGVRLKSSDELTDEQDAAIAEVSETTTKDGGSIKFKLHSKMDGLDKLGRYFKLFTDNLNLSGKLSVEELKDMSDAELDKLLEDGE